MRFLVFMCDNRPLTPTLATAGYHSLAAAINSSYCSKHGYDFAYYCPFYETVSRVDTHNCRNPITGAPRHAAWSKFLGSLEAMKHTSYDYYVYIDSDCIFRNTDMKLEDTVAKDPEADVFFMNNRPWEHTRLCTGFYILKNTERARQFMRNSYSINVPYFDTNHHWEQEACRRIIEGGDRSVRHYLVDTIWFDEQPGQQLRHVGSHTGNLRVPYFQERISALRIDYNATIRRIPIHFFSTKNYRL